MSFFERKKKSIQTNTKARLIIQQIQACSTKSPMSQNYVKTMLNKIQETNHLQQQKNRNLPSFPMDIHFVTQQQIQKFTKKKKHVNVLHPIGKKLFFPS